MHGNTWRWDIIPKASGIHARIQMGLGFSSILIPVPRGTAAADIIILIFALLIAVKLEIRLGRLERGEQGRS